MTPHGQALPAVQPPSEKRLAEICNIAAIDNNPDTWTHTVTRALRDALAEIDRLRKQAAPDCPCPSDMRWHAFNCPAAPGLLMTVRPF